METVIDEKIEFVSAEEAEKLDKLMAKDYVKRGPDGKALKSKEFIYRIISCHPYEKAGQYPPAGKFLVKVEVQKFYRNKFIDNKILVSGQERTQKENQKVEAYVYSGITDNKFSPGGNWNLADGDANRMMDLREFQEMFAVDTAE